MQTDFFLRGFFDEVEKVGFSLNWRRIASRLGWGAASGAAGAAAGFGMSRILHKLWEKQIQEELRSKARLLSKMSDKPVVIKVT